jgi:CoA:oxalate CoA-transferase
MPAGEVLSIPEVIEHPQVTKRELIKNFQSVPGLDRPVAVVRSGFRLTNGDPQPSTPPPSLGADTEQILTELGYDHDAVARLRRNGAI